MSAPTKPTATSRAAAAGSGRLAPNAAPGPGPTPAAFAPRGRIAGFWASTVGKKVVMAGTGLIMAGFLVAHMTGNLLAFAGPAAINNYSHFLHETPELLWPARAVLLASVIFHVVATVQLVARTNAARPTKYARRDPQASTFASRTMRWGGLLLLIFIVLHLLHLTTGTVHPAFVEGDPYGNVVRGFGRYPVVAVLYILAMVVIGLHLYHGLWSSFRTLGATTPSAYPLRHRASAALAVILWLGFTAVPVAVLVGALR